MEGIAITLYWPAESADKDWMLEAYCSSISVFESLAGTGLYFGKSSRKKTLKHPLSSDKKASLLKELKKQLNKELSKEFGMLLFALWGGGVNTGDNLFEIYISNSGRCNIKIILYDRSFSLEKIKKQQLQSVFHDLCLYFKPYFGYFQQPLIFSAIINRTETEIPLSSMKAMTGVFNFFKNSYINKPKDHFQKFQVESHGEYTFVDCYPDQLSKIIEGDISELVELHTLLNT